MSSHNPRLNVVTDPKPAKMGLTVSVTDRRLRIYRGKSFGDRVTHYGTNKPASNVKFIIEFNRRMSNYRDSSFRKTKNGLGFKPMGPLEAWIGQSTGMKT